jgi:hypothetical protein
MTIATTKTTMKTMTMMMINMMFIFQSFSSLSLITSSFLNSIHQLTAFACHSYYHLFILNLRMAPFRSTLYRWVLLSLVGPVWHK